PPSCASPSSRSSVATRSSRGPRSSKKSLRSIWRRESERGGPRLPASLTSRGEKGTVPGSTGEAAHDEIASHARSPRASLRLRGYNRRRGGRRAGQDRLEQVLCPDGAVRVRNGPGAARLRRSERPNR